MELRHLRYFKALAERLHFTQAAEKVHVSQSTLSHQIRQLEQELGQTLFERVGKRVVMTEAGEVFLAHATRALSEIDQGVRQLQQVGDPLTSELRIAASHSLTVNLLGGCLAQYLSKYPAVRVVVEELPAAAIYEGLRQDRVDIGMIYRPPELEDLWFEPLFTEELVLVVSQEHTLAARRRIRMVELHHQQLVMLTRGFATRQMIEDYLQSVNAEASVVVEMNTVAPMVALVRTLQLATIVAQSEYRLYATPDLRVINIESPTPVRTTGILWKRGSPRSAAVRAFVATIRRAAIELNLKVS